MFSMARQDDLQLVTLAIYGALYALSGLGNFWALRRPRPGGILLLGTSLFVFTAIAIG